MKLLGRSRELGALRNALDLRDPSIVEVSGPDGSGKSALVAEATRGLTVVRSACPPLPDPSQRLALANAVRSALGRALPDPADGVPDWTTLFGWIADAAEPDGPALVIVVDEAHRLAEARSKLDQALDLALSRASKRSGTWHLVLVGRPGGIPTPDLGDRHPRTVLRLGPLPFRSALPFLPGGTPADRLESYAVFGGHPGVLRHLDAAAGLQTNIRRLLLTEGAPLAAFGLDALEREVQTPSRYAAILSTLSAGEADWATVHVGVEDLTSSGQLAPYLKRLEELAVVETRRSLDARPRSRSRRYRITDPLMAFWYRLAGLTGWRLQDAGALTPAALRAAIDAQAASEFPAVCRQFMEHDAIEVFGHNGREVGSLWGAHHEAEVAGILTSGAAFYGSCHWIAPPTTRDVRSLDRSIRETRYGFGRESRLRVMFTRHAPGADLARAAARRHDLMLISLEDLVGGDTNASGGST